MPSHTFTLCKYFSRLEFDSIIIKCRVKNDSYSLTKQKIQQFQITCLLLTSSVMVQNLYMYFGHVGGYSYTANQIPHASQTLFGERSGQQDYSCSSIREVVYNSRGGWSAVLYDYMKMATA